MNKLPKLDLNITNRCNFRCVHCAFDSGEINLPELSLEKITEILEDTKKLGGEKFDITGGEPLVRSDINEIIEIGKNLGYKIELVTNGSLLTPKRLKEFKERGLDSFAISLDGPDYKTHSTIRRISKETYQKSLQSIDNILESGITLKINTVVFQSNYKKILELTQWCINKGVYEHGLYYFTAIGRGQRHNEKSVPPLTWLDFIRNNLQGLDDKIKLSLELPFIERGKLIGKETKCLAEAEQYHLQILPDGNVYPCAIMASYQLPLANLYECSVPDIWKNKKLWDNYWNKVGNIFRKNKNSCVNFDDSFDSGELERCKFVCPLRKFYPGDVL